MTFAGMLFMSFANALVNKYEFGTNRKLNCTAEWREYLSNAKDRAKAQEEALSTVNDLIKGGYMRKYQPGNGFTYYGLTPKGWQQAAKKLGKTEAEEKKMKQIALWADGACKGNGAKNAIAGWGVVLKMGDYEKTYSGKVPGDQTNNRAELTAVISGLAELKYKCQVTVYTDSKTVCSAPGCILRGYMTASKKPAANRDLLEELAHLLDFHDVKFEKVAGHSGNKYNELCDQLASAACVK